MRSADQRRFIIIGPAGWTVTFCTGSGGVWPTWSNADGASGRQGR